MTGGSPPTMKMRVLGELQGWVGPPKAGGIQWWPLGSWPSPVVHSGQALAKLEHCG